MPLVLFVVDGKLSRLSGSWVLTQIRLDRPMAWHAPFEGCHGAAIGPRPMAKGIKSHWHARKQVVPKRHVWRTIHLRCPAGDCKQSQRGELTRKRWGIGLLRLPGATSAMHRSYPTFSTKSRKSRRWAASREICQRMRHRFEHRWRRISPSAVAGLWFGGETAANVAHRPLVVFGTSCIRAECLPSSGFLFLSISCQILERFIYMTDMRIL